MSASTEASRYRSHARRSYTPPGPASDPWGPYIREAATKFDMPHEWIRAVMRQESGGNLYLRGELITSNAGAMGLMQVMPGTYDELRSRYSELGGDPFDPHDNIMAGTAYLREMYDIYGSPGFLAAYNAGPGRLDDYLTRNRALPAETRRYVASIGPRLAGAEPRRGSPGAQYAMNAVPAAIPAGPRYPDRTYTPPVAYAEAVPALPLPEPAPVAVAMNVIPPPEPAPAPLPPVSVVPPMPVSQPYSAPLPALPPVIQVAELPDDPSVDDLPEPPARAAPRPMRQRVERPREALPAAPVRVAVARGQREVLPPPSRSARLPQHVPFQMAAASQRQAPGKAGFHLIAPAMAEPVNVHHGGPPTGNWGIQVGAFASSGLASAATAAARGEARGDLGHARGSVSEVRHGHATLYRARLQGLSRDSAARACERLAKQRTSCMVVSPDAQG